jgi:phospholipid transport system substrate-binding protein
MRKMMLVLVLFVLAAVPAWSADQPPSGAGDPARDAIRHFYDGLVATMKSGRQLGFQGRFDALAPLVDQTFDMPEMTRLSLGYTAKSLSAEQLADLTAVFRRYTIASYAANFEEFGGERFDVGEPRPGQNGAVVVPSVLTPGDKSDPVQLDYVMHEISGRWGITDVLAEGAVSEVARRRSEFVSVLRKDGFDGLVKAIERKTDALASKG